MGHRLSKIYTRTGDKGTTGLGDGSRVDKDSTRIEAIGSVDELNSHIGMLRATLPADHHLQPLLSDIQHDLFDLGGSLCLPDAQPAVGQQHVVDMERILDQYNEQLPPLKNFILPPAMKPQHVAMSRGRSAAEPNAVSARWPESRAWHRCCCSISTAFPICCLCCVAYWLARTAAARCSGNRHARHQAERAAARAPAV